MTEAVGSGGGFRAGLLERLFRRADQDGSNAVGSDEIQRLLNNSDAKAAAKIVETHDTNADGSLSLEEFSGARLAPETMQGLLTVQEYRAAARADRQADDRAVIDAMFARADVDGDGALSRDEFDAERALQFAATLDAGDEVPQHMFAVMPGAFDDQVSKDEIMLGRRLMDVADAIKLDDPDIDPELLERLKAVRPLDPRGGGEPTAPRPDTATVMRDTVNSADLTEALVARLLKQLEASATAVAAGQSIDGEV
jgi:Ca2+-binding EF-hand superfamily protein